MVLPRFQFGLCDFHFSFLLSIFHFCFLVCEWVKTENVTCSSAPSNGSRPKAAFSVHSCHFRNFLIVQNAVEAKKSKAISFASAHLIIQDISFVCERVCLCLCFIFKKQFPKNDNENVGQVCPESGCRVQLPRTTQHVAQSA